MAVVTNRGTSQIWKKAVMEKWIQNAIICMWVTLTCQWLKFYFIRLSDSKHRLLRLYIKYNGLIKDIKWLIQNKPEKTESNLTNFALQKIKIRSIPIKRKCKYNI
jgi:hypothetical protein